MPSDSFPGFVGIFQAANRADSSCTWFFLIFSIVGMAVYCGIAYAFSQGYTLHMFACLVCLLGLPFLIEYLRDLGWIKRN